MAREYDHLFKLLIIGDSGKMLLVLPSFLQYQLTRSVLIFQVLAKALYYYALQTILLQGIILLP